MSHFSSISEAPVDSIFGLNAAFSQDPRKHKINLGIGVYKTEDLQTPILSCVKHAEKDLLENETTKNYLPVEGDTRYLQLAARLVFGDSLHEANYNCLTSMQTVGGCGALRLGAEFLAKEKQNTIYIPDPTWPNHKGIFLQSGLKVETYPYYDPKRNCLNIEIMMEFLSKIPMESIVLFHVNCHNPSGADLERKDWEALIDICSMRRLIPFFDAAYLGFDQTVELDAFPLRLFMEKQVEFLLALSFSKNFSLYAERVGAFFLFSEQTCSKKILSQCKLLARRNYSNPPLHGVKVVSKILQDSFLKKLWEEELLQMRQRIFEMRNNFVVSLSIEGSKKDYSYLLQKKGLFCFSGLLPEQVTKLIQEYAIYITLDGRINLAGLNQKSLSFVVRSIISVGG